MQRKSNKGLIFILVVIGIFVLIDNISNIASDFNESINTKKTSNTLNILSSYDNEYVEDKVKSYAKKNKIEVSFTYMGDLDIVEELNNNSKNYDAVWISNSMWLYMLNNSYITSESKSISISPVVFGIKKSKAKELGLIDKDITNKEIVELIQDRKIKYVMSSVTRTNTGATAYLGFLNALAGNPSVLTSEIINDEKLLSNLKNLFSGVSRVSGDEKYLTEMFLKSDLYEALIADESSLININQQLEKQNKEPLYLLYPTDGVAINDSTFAFIQNDINKKEKFLEIQSYLLSSEGQKMLLANGRRTWYGGINDKIDNNVFNNNWGIDTKKYLNVTRYPSKSIMNEALNIYIEKLRKPTHLVFCLDYSGSMYGDGIEELINSMDYILDYDKAKEDRLQFSLKDKITVITFSSYVTNIWNTDSGYKTENLIKNIKNFNTGGSTALYDAIIRGLNILEKESDDYTKTIIAMTDGAVNVGTFESLSNAYNLTKKDIPIYSITFGSADYRQLNAIANLTNAKVFDGTTSLLEAFKEVRGYN